MWPRVIELMLGLWIVISPFIFSHPAQRRDLWTHDLSIGTAVAVLALLSLWRPLRHSHLLTIFIGSWLVWFGWSAAAEASLPAHQNHIVLGILLIMLAIVPNEINIPPETWRRGHHE